MGSTNFIIFNGKLWAHQSKAFTDSPAYYCDTMADMVAEFQVWVIKRQNFNKGLHLYISCTTYESYKRFFCLSFTLLVCFSVLENLIFFSVCLLKELSQFKNHVNILLQFMNHKKCWVLKLRYIYIRTIFDQI